MIENIKYFDDNPNHGIMYDWKHLQKEYKKLKCPKHVFNPFSVDFTKTAYGIIMSDRSAGKTTNPLLLGLIMYRDYGTITHVIRQSKYICEPKMIQDMFKTILEFDYITKIFGGKWNSVRYRGKRWRLVLLDEESGRILEESEPVVACFGLDEWEDLKSAYNAQRGDLVIFDEFVNSKYSYDDFVHFMDILKTIFRDRRGYVYMLSNTIDLYTPWFDEFCLRDQIEDMKAGEKRVIHTALNTSVHIELLTPIKTKQRLFINSWLFGFPNPKLAAITGADTWAMKNYQHIPHDKESESTVIYGKVLLYQAGKYVKLKLVTNDKVGLCVYVHPVTHVYDDDTILTAGDITSKNQQFGFGNKDSMILTTIWRLYAANKFYYFHNSAGALVESYINSVKLKKRNMGI